MSPSPLPKSARRRLKPAVQKQRKALAKEPTKRKIKAQSQSSSRPTKTQKKTDTAWKSAKELVREAPQEFAEYLAGQLDATQQAQFAVEFGGGQGFIVKLPPSTWQSKSAREKFATWVQALGFSFGGTLSRNVLRAASLKADVILNEEVATPLVAATTKDNNGASEHAPDSNGIAKQEMDTATEGYANDPAMLRLKEYFQKLDSQKLEVLSYSENHRLLSSARHMEIADAMEDVLAQPSVRRDRRLARRLSQLGRISGRRMSAIPLLPASILPPVEDDWVWDAELEKMSLTPVKRPRLLNFFLKDIGRAGSNKKEGADFVLHYLLEDACFELRMPASFSYWVKLADYGSADSNPENLDKPVTIDQFTTLENSPIEFLLEGDSARQSYAADTFSLGLCLLHLFSGRYACLAAWPLGGIRN
ncbi:hypothetical protein BBJ28_00011652 [Nothophytophthora sp. Chile5]|nr:hypothetical protein BBJ28_00011652 [Nothophytophthora sp. Chile5]